MVGGAKTSSGSYKIGSGFTFVAKPLTFTGGSQMALYCGELGMWIGTSSQYDHPYYPVPPGGTMIVYNSSGYVTEGGSAISECSFCDVTTTVSGSGSIVVGGTDYNGRRMAGTSVTLTCSPTSGYRLKKLIVNGSTVATSNNSYTISSVQDDIAAVAYFVPTSYTVTCNSPSGGSVSFTKNGASASTPFTANVDEVIVCTATPNTDKMVQNFVVDGYVTSGGSTGPQTFTFTIYEREDDAVYNCNVSFCDRTAVADSVVGISGATFDPESETPTVPIDDATVTCNGTAVSRTNGAFLAYVGNTYVATAHAPTVFRTFGGWVNGNGELVSEAYSYGWTQGSQSVAITAAYADNPLYAENFLIGTSTSDAGTQSGTAYVAGCRATITRPSEESKVVGDVTKYLGGTRTVSVHGVSSTELPANWTFSGVYVSDTNASGGTKFYKANGASSVTFDNACDANIYAIFANGGTITPGDSDQGNSSIATGTAATGLFEWEGGASDMTMRYHSKRFVASMPMAISAARVYADGYATSSVNDVNLKVLAFQSPDTDDSRVTETTAKSQDAYRQPMRRPEKYIEVEVSAPHQVTQIAIATSMEALWQA